MRKRGYVGLLAALTAVALVALQLGHLSSAVCSALDPPGSASQPLTADMKPRPPPVRLSAWEGRRCEFKGCPADHPRLYFFTPHRNRTPSYQRLLRGLAADVQQDKALDGACVCILVVDFNGVVVGPPLTEAMPYWPYDAHIVQTNATFSPAGAFTTALNVGVLNNTKPEQSIVFRLDADIVIFPGMVRRVLNNTLLGSRAYAPVCWSTHKPGSAEAVSQYTGWWRVSGTGMLAFYVSDYLEQVGAMPLADRTKYGSEDHELFLSFDQRSTVGFNVTRECAPELWHIWHAKRKWNADTFDGRHYRKHAPKDWEWTPGNVSSWLLPDPAPGGADLLRQHVAHKATVCLALTCGEPYAREGYLEMTSELAKCLEEAVAEAKQRGETYPDNTPVV